MSRKVAAIELAEWVGVEKLELIDAGSGWPSHFRAKATSGWVDIAVYLGPIGNSQRDRDDVERRFQNPGKGRPIVEIPGRIPVLLGMYNSDGTHLLVGMEVAKRLGKSTRQSLFMPLHLLRSAGTYGWAEHFSDAGERLVAFHPQLLPIYLELLRASVVVPAAEIEALLIASGAADIEPSTEALERAVTTIERLVRKAKFRREVREAYGGRCALCGLDFSLVEGAHIYPVAAPGSKDEVWNGIALCRNHHAAFDSFLVYIEPGSRRVTLHPDLIEEAGRVQGCKAFVEATFPLAALPSAKKFSPRNEMYEKRYEFFRSKYAWL